MTAATVQLGVLLLYHCRNCPMSITMIHIDVAMLLNDLPLQSGLGE